MLICRNANNRQELREGGGTEARRERDTSVVRVLFESAQRVVVLGVRRDRDRDAGHAESRRSRGDAHARGRNGWRLGKRRRAVSGRG